jgi:hypothetical protein
MAPYTVRQFPSLELLFPGKLMTTCDPYLLRLYPEQLLMHNSTSLPSTPRNAQATLCPSSGTPATSPEDPLLTSLEFMACPSSLLYHRDTEVPAIFQGGPGKFQFSKIFCEEYKQRHGTEVDLDHRVDNTRALDLYASLGPWLSNGPSANILVAIAPRKAYSSLKVRQVNDDGTEVVYVDTEHYAACKTAELGARKPRSAEGAYVQK